MRLKTIVRTLLTVLVGTSLCTAQQPGTMRGSKQSSQSGAIYSKLPLTFEANRGQTNGQVNFLSRGKGYTAFLTIGGMTLSLRTAPVANGPSRKPQHPTSKTLQFGLLGANRSPVAVGEDLQPGIVNYFIGNKPAQWHTGVPTYARVRYKNVYPGIDLIYYGNHQQLEYDFAVSPGADPRRIQFEITGADQISIDAEGSLVLHLGGDELHFQSPIVYQESNGKRIPLDGGYLVQDQNHIGFQVSEYDPNKPLVIDPVLLYSTYLGGTGNDQAAGIAVDAAGSVYVTGYTDSADFPSTTILGSVATGTTHVFVAKLDSTGTNLVYADYLGGTGSDFGYAMVLDSANDVYVSGSTSSSDFPVVNPYQASMSGSQNAFASKISADGSSLLYSTYLGGNDWDQPSSVGLDSFGELYVAGTTQSLNFPTVNAYQSSVSANQGGMYGLYGFLSKFNPNGSSLVYSTYLGGNSNVIQQCWNGPCWPVPYNLILSVAVDANGDAYVTGNTNTYNFPVTNGAYLTTDSAPADTTVSFVSKFSGTGNLNYSTYLYGASGSPTETAAIAVDGSGSAYVTGSTISDGTFPITSTSICDPNVYGQGCGNAFVTKFDPTLSSLLYSTFLGPNNYAIPQAMALDANDNTYIMASTSTGSFATVNGIEPYSNGSDILLAEIDASGTSQLFATYLGGSATELPGGITVDSNGDIYVAGSTDSIDFPVTSAAFQNLPLGSTDSFILKIGPASAPAFAASPAALEYAAEPLGMASSAQTVLLRNMGSSPLLISSINSTGDFVETNNCGTSVPAASSCNISVTFTPTAVGARAGSVLVNDNAAGSPHLVKLTGTGLGALVSLTPVNLAFASQQVGTASVPRALTLANNGNAGLNVSSIAITGDYTDNNNCPAVLPSGSSCVINVKFAPTVSGIRSGTLTITDSAQSSPQTVSLSGNGADFRLTSSTGSATINAGSAAKYLLTLTPLGGAFNNTITLNCSGAPAQTTCSVSPNAVTPGGSPATATLTITTTATAAQAVPAHLLENRVFCGFWIQIPGIGLLGMILTGRKNRSRKRQIAAALLLIIAALIFMSGCAGGTGTAPPTHGTNPGTYTITVSGTAGALRHSLPLTLTVQ